LGGYYFTTGLKIGFEFYLPFVANKLVASLSAPPIFAIWFRYCMDWFLSSFSTAFSL
jgi:uncharacterized BrkB/YihY/UPF0761 family membrane protein